MYESDREREGREKELNWELLHKIASCSTDNAMMIWSSKATAVPSSASSSTLDVLATWFGGNALKVVR
jgi:hypothetical protein